MKGITAVWLLELFCVEGAPTVVGDVEMKERVKKVIAVDG